MVLRFCKSRTYHDPLHGSIQLDGGDRTEALLIRLIDTPAFQRLRRIRQLDTASLTFHGAEGSRFTHSVGVLHVARRIFDQLAQHHEDLRRYRSVALVAALLHDIGHSPFSHAGEEIFGCHHELWTCRIVKEDLAIAELFDICEPGLADQLQQVYRHRFPIPVVSQLISSQLDCDRLDYLLRDSHYTGAQYGRLDLDRIVTVLGYDPATQQLTIPERKGLGAIEHYLVVRYFMYAQVYHHPKSIAARFVLTKLYERARTLLQAGELSCDRILTAWLQGPVDQLPLDLYLAADDILFQYPIRFWCDHPDPVLADLARRYLDRDLFKARNIAALPPDRQADLQAAAAAALAKLDLPANYYLGVRSSYARGYTPYQEGICLRGDRGDREIADLSPLVNSLAHTQPKTRLIFPREIEDIIETHLKHLSPSEVPAPLTLPLPTNI
ncbi:HD domain-containing protein [Synechococcus sp. PCC 7336]|uniref:HD domain-containing protein n=1 Tax=Synechococcus sp. PCC 7336 TaxID=195250 RepID=UPI0003489558|nr:HD domain-containing protein [Synechococcus sp. PCC 7336]